MFEDEPSTKPKRSLEEMSLEELASQIETLKQEIVRCEEEIVKKKSVKNAADAIFGQ